MLGRKYSMWRTPPNNKFYKDDCKRKTLQEKHSYFIKGNCELTKIQIHRPNRYLHCKQNAVLEKQWTFFCKLLFISANSSTQELYQYPGIKHTSKWLKIVC